MRIDSNLRTKVGTDLGAGAHISVLPGETRLSEVAERLGISVPELRGANPHLTSDHVQSGQRLLLPAGFDAGNHLHATESPKTRPTGEAGSSSRVPTRATWDPMAKALAQLRLGKIVETDISATPALGGESASTSTAVSPTAAPAEPSNRPISLLRIIERLLSFFGGGSVSSRDATTTKITPAPTLTPATALPTMGPNTSHAAPAALSNPFSGYVSHVPSETETAPPPSATEWSPYIGPKDARDQIAEGGGKTTASGSPLIKNNEKSASNQYGYSGPATLNPYFTTPSNPLREGYVVGFGNWFSNPMIHGGPSGPIPANKMQYSTEEGAQEALRIVKQFVPEASIVQSFWRSGPYAVDKPLFEIDLGGGRKLNAGGVLTGYYNQGHGVTISSDDAIRRAIQIA